MKVTLSPPELGKVEVEVKAHGNRVEIEMRSQNVGTKSILEQQLGELKNAMLEHDLVLSKVDVQVARETTPSSDMQFSFTAGHSFAQAQNGSGQWEMGQPSFFSQSSHHRQPVVSESLPSAPSVTSAPRVNSGTGRVDLRI